MYQYPYGNAQQLNLDWLMEQWQTVKQSIDGSLQGEIDRVEAAITDLLAARDAAVAAAGAANTSAGAAAASAQAAAADAATATAQAAAATQERVNAAQAANNAQQYAGNAQTQAAAAQNAAGQAAASASQAAADASDAHDDAVAASGSAVNAAASAAGALQNFQLSDAARQAAQAAEQDAEAAATLLQPPATSADIGKALIVKTVGGGTVTAYELGGGGGSPAIVNTIENVQIASFDDGTVNPVQQLVVDIEPVQSGSGDPAPDNVRPITGWTGANVVRTGKNVFDGEVENGALDPATGDNTPNPQRYRSKNYISVKPSTTYVLSKDGTVQSADWYSYGANKNYLSDVARPYTNTITTSADTYYLRFFGFDALNSNKIQLELGSTATTYEEYKGQTIPVTFPDSAGTVYGAKLINDGTDVWKLRVEKIGIAPYIISLQSINVYNIANFGFDLPSNTIRDHDESICNILSKQTSLISQTQTVGYMVSNERNCYLRLDGTTVDTVAKARQWVIDNNCLIVYKLATPVEYTFTTSEIIQLLSGYNNVWADTGNINLLEYFANSKTYIDEQNTIVKALIAPVLDDMIADTALTANDFRIVDNTLYRITAPVAAGAALTPNTNCTATTIGAILKTLLT